MKKVVTLLLAMVATVGAWAQDVIVKTDGSTVLCRVVEINGTDVIYLKWSDLNGPRYVMDRSMINNINYQDGRQDKFGGQTSNAYSPGNQQTGSWEYNDNALLAMDQARNFKQPEDPNLKKAKKFKKIGWIVGGALTAVGLGVLSWGIYIGYDECWNWPSDWVPQLAVGSGLILGGVTTATICLVKAKKLEQQAKAIASAPIIEHEFSFGNGKSLAAGVDVIRDNFSHRMTVGVGLRFNF